MRKIFILALAVLVTCVALAETDPVFSGEFSTYFRVATDKGIDEKKRWDDDYSISASIKLNSTIDEWNSVSAEVETKNAAYLDSDDITPIRSLEKKTDYLRLKDFVINTDITGALGLDWPVQLSMKTGKQEFPAVNVAEVAPASTEDASGGETSKNIGFIFDLKILDKVTISSVLFPKNLLNGVKDKMEAGVTIKATDIALGPIMLDVAAFYISSESNFGINEDHKDNYTKKTITKDNYADIAKKEKIDISSLSSSEDADKMLYVYNNLKKEQKRFKIHEEEGKLEYYIADKDEEKDDKDGVDIGFNFALKFMDNNLKIGAGFVLEEAEKNKNEAGVQLDVGYTWDKLTAGISFGTSNISKFLDKSSLNVAASYDILSALGVYGGVSIPFEKGKTPKFSFGVNTALKALAIQIGFTNEFDYKSPEDDWKNTAFIKFSTSF